jgi:hypothetical protein
MDPDGHSPVLAFFNSGEVAQRALNDTPPTKLRGWSTVPATAAVAGEGVRPCADPGSVGTNQGTADQADEGGRAGLRISAEFAGTVGEGKGRRARHPGRVRERHEKGDPGWRIGQTASMNKLNCAWRIGCLSPIAAAPDSQNKRSTSRFPTWLSTADFRLRRQPSADPRDQKLRFFYARRLRVSK